MYIRGATFGKRMALLGTALALSLMGYASFEPLVPLFLKNSGAGIERMQITATRNPGSEPGREGPCPPVPGQ